MRKLFCACALALSAACNWPRLLEPDLGITAAEVRVEDQHGDRVAGVRVTFNDWTAAGEPFTVSGPTNDRGHVTFVFRTAGTRRCEIVPPAGFRAGSAGLVQNVEITAGATTQVRFEIVR
jgi:hypothetical protein